MAFRKFGTGPDQQLEQEPVEEGLQTTAAVQTWGERDAEQLRKENESADRPPASPEQ